MNTLQEKALTSEDEQLSSIVKRLGNPISTLLLDSNYSIFRTDEIDGLIGYKIYNNCALVVGDPLCLPEDISALAYAFQQFCKLHQWRIVYFLASEAFAHWAIAHGYQSLIQVGEQSVIDPTGFRIKQKLRWKINQSIQQGVSIKEYKEHDPVLEHKMLDSINEWQQAKQGPQIYLGDLSGFNKGSERRIFYALQNENIVGLLKLSPLDRFHGWVINYFLAIPNAPIGTTEYLISSACNSLAKEDCHFICLGINCGTHLGEIVGLNAMSKVMAEYIYKIAKWFFNLEAKRIYLNKYHPHFSPTYILFQDSLNLKELLALKKILNVKL